MFYKEEFDWCINHPILKQYENLLETLALNDRTMCLYYHENSFYIMECCDDHFTHKLSREECIELSELFKKLANVY